MSRRRGRPLIALVMLACAACAHGPRPNERPLLSFSAPPSRTVSDVFEALDADATDAQAWLREIVAKAPPEAGDPRTLAEFHNRRGRAWGTLGSVTNQLSDMRAAIRLTEGKNFLLMFETAVLEYSFGNYKNAVELLETARPLRGERSKFMSDASLAWYAAAIGDLRRGDDLLRAAEAALARQKQEWSLWELSQHTDAAMLSRTEYYIALSRGKYEAAEAAAHATLLGMANDEEPARVRRARGLPTSSEGWGRSVYANDEGRLAHVLALQGKLAEAEVVARSSLRHHLANSGRLTNDLGRTLIPFARLLAEQGRFVEAEGMARRAIDTFERIGIVPHAVHLNEARLARAEALVALGRWPDALAECQRRREGLAGDPEMLNRIGAEDLSCAIALLRVGAPGDAKAMLETLRQRTSERFGSDHYAVHELDGFLGVALMELGDQRGALARFRAAFPGLRTPGGAVDRSPWKTQRLGMILEAYIGLLYELRRTPGQAADALDAAGEAFAVADIAHGQSIQRAVAAAAARAAVADRRLAPLVRREQDLANESTALYDILRRLAAAPRDQQPPAAAAEVRARIDAIGRERQALSEQIARAFPDYANLRQPRPVTLGETRSVLAPGEVMLSILVGAARTFVWAVPRDGPVAFYASALTRDQVAEHVATLRASLDVGAASPSVMPEFDTGLAHRLYRELLAPGRPVWKDASSLLVVTSGPLSQLPLAVLPTEPAVPAAGPVRDQGYAAVPWLVRQVAIVQVPSVNSLVALRAMPSGRPDRKIFVGFGDPVFGDGASEIAAGTGAETSLAMRNLSVTRATSDTTRGNKPVRWTPYSHLPPLPDTRDEVLAIARALGADPGRDVFLGRQASRDTVRRLDLTSRRILAFATHGLLPGDFLGIEQPALALAAPPGAGADTNPRLAMLTLDDVLSLKLDADLVVLSACNSAAGDGRGSDAISGLGRAFFYAGSRALLVTHWPVESRSARLLVTGIFERYVADSTLSRAEALRQSMLSLMEGAPNDPAGTPVHSYAHPMFWAPFALVGDPGPMSSAGQAAPPPRSAPAETP